MPSGPRGSNIMSKISSFTKILKKLFTTLSLSRAIAIVVNAMGGDMPNFVKIVEMLLKNDVNPDTTYHGKTPRDSINIGFSMSFKVNLKIDEKSGTIDRQRRGHRRLPTKPQRRRKNERHK